MHIIIATISALVTNYIRPDLIIASIVLHNTVYKLISRVIEDIIVITIILRLFRLIKGFFKVIVAKLCLIKGLEISSRIAYAK